MKNDEYVVLSLSDIIPGDTPRRTSQDFIEQIWGQEGPPPEVIDLTDPKFEMSIIKLVDGRHYCYNGNNRLGYIAKRSGVDQQVRLPIVDERDILDERMIEIRADIDRKESLGILSFADYDKHETVERETWIDDRKHPYSPYH